MVRYLSLLFIFISSTLLSVSQENTAQYRDSLIKVYTTSKHDTTKIQALIFLSEIYYRTNPDTLVDICEQAIEFIDKKLKSQISHSEKVIFIVNKASAYANMAAMSEDQSNLKRAIEYNNKALKLYKSVEYHSGTSTVLNNLGKIMKIQGELESAIDLYSESLHYADLSNNKKGKAYTIGNIGAIHYSKGNYREALESFIKAKVLHNEVNDVYGLAVSLNNIGSVYRNLNMLDNALKSYQETFKLCKETSDIKQQANSAVKISTVYGLMKDYQNSEKYGLLALELSQKSESVKVVLSAKKNLYELYRKMNQPGKSLLYFEQFVSLKDSINTEDNQKAIIEQRIQYEYDKQALADSVKFAEQKKAEITVKNLEIESVRTQRYLLFGGLSIFIVLSFFIFNRYQISQKQSKIIASQKEIVEHQKSLVEYKNKEVTDSITYAKRIQNTILPSTHKIESILPNSTLFYKPKDIVAGDFYWFEKLPTELNNSDSVFFAAADCTGHGVPGALVSVVCSNALNHSLQELKTDDPSKILNRTREIVIHQFSNDENHIADGMDIALCCINTKTLALKYAGANNNLYIVRNNNFIEYQSNREPVGVHTKMTPFKLHEIQLQKDDTIILSTDGFADQFGGETGKKLKSKPFKQLLTTISGYSLENQKKYLQNFFDEWKGNYEQVDDVCVLIVKV